MAHNGTGLPIYPWHSIGENLSLCDNGTPLNLDIVVKLNTECFVLLS